MNIKSNTNLHAELEEVHTSSGDHDLKKVMNDKLKTIK